MPAFGISRAIVPSAGIPKTGMTFRARDRYEMCPALLRDSATQLTQTAVAHAPVRGHGTCRTIGRCLKPSADVDAKPFSDRNGDQGNKANIVATQHGTPWRSFFFMLPLERRLAWASALVSLAVDQCVRSREFPIRSRLYRHFGHAPPLHTVVSTERNGELSRNHFQPRPFGYTERHVLF